MAIDLNFSDEQRMLQQSARDFLDRHCTPALVRRYENSEEEFPAALWRQMADLGWLGMSLPSDFGGLDASFLDSYALYLELGRALAPTPHIENALSGDLIAALGTDAQKNALLPGIATGETIIAPALMEPDGDYGPTGVTLRAEASGAGYTLSGVKVLVPFAGSAARLLCAARTGDAKTGGAKANGVTLFLVDPKAKGVAIERTPNIAGRPLSAVTFDKVAVSADDVLGKVGAGWAPLQNAINKAAVLQCALVIGAGARVLDLSVSYAKERVQFGEPIGKYQFVQQFVTDIAIQRNNLELLGLFAAWRIDAGLPFAREASMAKAASDKAAASMTFCAHEVHAGIGFMLDYDLQLYTKRAKYWETNFGDSRHHLERVTAESLNGVSMNAAAGETATGESVS